MKRYESKKALLASVRSVIARYNMIQPGDGVVVAVSGGPDSTALMYILNLLQAELDFWMVPAHLDHGLRAESGADAEFVRKMSLRFGLELRERRVNVRDLAAESGISVEEAGRRARYAFFEEIRSVSGARVIATAHQMDDVFETFLLRIVRGSSLKGLTGIPPTRGPIVRPLIETPRAVIIRFLEEEGIAYRIDRTNLETRSDRNFVRNRLIPAMEEHFPDFRSPLSRTITLLGEEERFVEELAQELYSQVISCDEDRLIVSVPRLASAHPVLASRVILLALYAISGPEVRWSRSHVQAVWKLLRSAIPSGEVHLPGSIRVARKYDELELSKSGSPDSAPLPVIQVSGPGTVEIPGTDYIFKFRIVPVLGAELLEYDEIAAVKFDADEVFFPFTLRGPRPADRFRPWGVHGTRKLKNVLIDLKIHRRLRKRVPLLLKDETILWIAGIRRSDAAPIHCGTRRILEVSIVNSLNSRWCPH